MCARVHVRDLTTLINSISGLGGGEMDFHQNRHQVIIKVQIYCMGEMNRVNLNFPKDQ